ncbi:MAG: hypothetical protein ACD_76C00069G0007 [uncultured bacterium]|nr:MAG: hypothetical protein ACD_76C00069G0007 [uncultured bacterium]HBD05125.1 transketolase [Candidatus Uhrbacteria bacterium]
MAKRQQAKTTHSILVNGWKNAKKVKHVPTRDGYGSGLVIAGKKNKNIVVLCADLTESTRSLAFKKAYPDRFIQFGVSEQSMASVAAGMSLAGKTPFISSYSVFSPGRNWEQIRTCIAIPQSNVKIAGAHSGVSVGPDGATHQMLEDIAIMRALPNMIVLAPCDALETEKAVLAAVEHNGPVYMRFAREKSPLFTTANTPFKIGRAETFRQGNDVAILAAGPLVYEALQAAEILSREKIQARVLNMHSIKPIDEEAIISAAKETGAIVTAEEAQVAGGLGGAVAEILAKNNPVPVEFIGMQDRFGESGPPSLLLEAFGLTAPYIALAAKRALARKNGKRVSKIPEHISEALKHEAELKKPLPQKKKK